MKVHPAIWMIAGAGIALYVYTQLEKSAPPGQSGVKKFALDTWHNVTGQFANGMGSAIGSAVAQRM